MCIVVFCNVILSHVVSVNIIILVEVYLLLMLPIIVTYGVYHGLA